MNTITCYHASPDLFREPSYSKCLQNRKNHENGNLGLWFSMEPSWIKGFGGNIYQFDINDAGGDKSIEVTCEQLFEWNLKKFNHVDYQNKRLQLIQQGYDFIKVIENGGFFKMGIVLNFDAIINFSLMVEKTTEPLVTRKVMHESSGFGL